MKICHLALEAPYNEGWGFQENLLTKYQVKMGHDVTLVISNKENCINNQQIIVPVADYISPDGFRVVRLDHIHFIPQKISNVIKIFKYYNLLCEIKPDLIMVHGLNNLSVLQVAKYVKKVNPNCKVIADSHLDYNIGAHLASNDLDIRIFRAVLRYVQKKMQKYYIKVYGVTPWRCEYCEDIYRIKKEKLDLLPAGADDEKIDYVNRDKIRAEIRKKHNISDDDFLIVTGGKIDKKKNIDKLMQAVTQLKNDNVKLLVFGQCADNIDTRVEDLAKNEKIRYIGWISSDKVYDYFMASDLVFFPGQHSVMWEQSVACGVPVVMKHYHAMQHCDMGGNAFFFKDDSVEGILKTLQDILDDEERYNEALKVAQSDKREQFLYSRLAEKAVEVFKTIDK